MAHSVKEIQVYPAAFPSEYDEAIQEVNSDLDSIERSEEERVWGEYQFDGNRYQCRVMVNDDSYKLLAERFPEAY